MKKRRLLMRTSILTVLAAAIALTIYANLTKGDSPKVEVGMEAPDFILTDINGNKHRLSDYKGQGVLLNFWATYCKPCEREMPLLEDQFHQYKDQGVVFLAVNIGETDMVVNHFVSKYELAFPILNDKAQEVLTAFGVDPLPVTFLIDKEGHIVKVHKGEILNEKMATEMIEEIKP